MNPEQLLSSIMTGMWDWMQANDYIYFILAIVAIVLVGKLIKASFKIVIKLGGAVVLLYLGWKVIQMIMEVI